jgi:DNA-binding NtrC family response regulator
MTPCWVRPRLTAWGGSVLVGENEEVLAKLVTTVLGEEGFRVSWLADPELAAVRDEVTRFEPDVVLLDGGNAIGYGESWQNAAWLHKRDTFAGFVAKPFDLEELIDLVASAAESRRCPRCRR